MGQRDINFCPLVYRFHLPDPHALLLCTPHILPNILSGGHIDFHLLRPVFLPCLIKAYRVVRRTQQIFIKSAYLAKNITTSWQSLAILAISGWRAIVNITGLLIILLWFSYGPVACSADIYFPLIHAGKQCWSTAHHRAVCCDTAIYGTRLWKKIFQPDFGSVAYIIYIMLLKWWGKKSCMVTIETRFFMPAIFSQLHNIAKISPAWENL